MPDEPLADASLTDVDEPGWAEEIKRLRAEGGERMAQQLTDDDRKGPPVE